MRTALLPLLLAASLTFAQEKPATLPDVASYGGERITVTKDIPFGSEAQQKLDLYRPKGEGPFPLVSARQLDAALRKLGVPHRLHLVPDAGHNPISLPALESIAAWLQERLK